MLAMLTAFITMNMSNFGIPSTKANSRSRTFPPLFTIKIPKEEEIVEDLQKIESMQLVVQVIMVVVCIIVAFIVLYYCCKKFRHMYTLFKYCFPFLPIFTDNDLTHITDDHFEINLVARLLDQICIVASPQSPPRCDDAPPDAKTFAQSVKVQQHPHL